jgi:hypothetical protein
MKITTLIDNLIGYFSGAAARIFGIDRNKYPTVGVQPFTGDINKED